MATPTVLEKGSRRDELEAFAVACDPSWHAYLIPLPSLPLAEQQRPQLLACATRLISALQGDGWERSVWLSLDELHQNDAIREVAKHGRLWAPEMGLGVRPEETGSSRYWTEKDLTDREYGAPLRPLMHSVLHLETTDAGAAHACATMTGTGGLIQALHRCTSTAMRGGWYETFQPEIEEDGLAAYPVYLPLLGAASVTKQSAATLSRWMHEAEIYIRESVEDKGIFILSRRPLEPELNAAAIPAGTVAGEEPRLAVAVVKGPCS